MDYPLIYRWKKYNPALFGRRCRILSAGSMNSVLVEFDDGVRHVVSRHAVREAPMDPTTCTREQLAALVLNMLETQQEYFRTKTHEKLRESKDKERRLRKLCGEILNPKARPQPGLFDEEPAT